MDDIDGRHSKKGVEDINTTGEGYLRTIDGQATTNFGNTTFLDYAISKDYLAGDVNTAHLLDAAGDLAPVKIQLGSIAVATDHNFITTDIAGGFDPASLVVDSWSAPINAVPEPSTSNFLSIIALSLILRRQRSDKK